MHRNIRSDNILCEDQNNLNVRLIDFDTAETIGGIHKNFDLINPYCTAPEIFKEESYNEKCDLWGVGVQLYLLLAGRIPFDGNSNDEIKQNVISGELETYYYPWNNISEEAKDLVHNLLKVNPHERYSAQQALDHPWFKVVSQYTHHLGDSLSNLKNFHQGSKLKQAVLGFFAQNLLTQQELNDLAKEFSAIDKNGNGTLSRDEIMEAYRNLRG